MSNDSLIGQQLGDYLIQSLLGKGGMASVYKGYDAKLDRYAAVKVIEPTLISDDEDEEYRERFLKEARAIARLNHPRVVGVYQFSNFDNLYYMAMVFVEGEDLRNVLKDYIRRGEKLTNAQLMRVMQDTAEALDYSHSQGVIHRDVKPSNIMIMQDGHAVLTDFGLALNASEGTIGNTFGSVHYIAPEQAVSSAQAVPQSDFYSLGVVLYEMLVGRVPFEDHSAMSVALKHISDPPPPPSTLNPEISPQIEEVVMKMLDKDPEKRYPNGKAFIYALEGAFAASEDDTHDLEESAATSTQPPPMEETAEPITFRSKEERKADPEDNIPTISDSSKVRPGSLPFSPTEEKNVPLEEDESGGRGWLMGLIAAVVVIVLIGVVIIVAGGGGGDDVDATSTAQAQVDSTAQAVAAISTETAVAEEAESANSTETAEAEANAQASQVAASETAAAFAEVHTQEATTTDEPTNTPQPTATDELTNTPESTATEAITNTPEPTATDEPTNTPEPTATLTVAGTPVFSTDILTPGADDPNEVLLRYDGRTLVLYNRSSGRININGLTFVRLSDNTTYRAREWDLSSNNLSSMRTRRCYQLYTTMYIEWQNGEPPTDICLSRVGFGQTVRSFWASRNDVTDALFEVRNNGQPIAQCPVAPWESDDDVYCLVDLEGTLEDDPDSG